MLYDARRSWAERGLCLPEDDHLFFAGADGHSPGDATRKAWEEAKKICRRCPVLEECRRDTLGESHGVWGGLNPLERRTARKRSAKALLEGPGDELMVWAEHIHTLREKGVTWADIQQKTGVLASACEQLYATWASHLQEQAPAGEVVDLPLPERLAKPFPDKPGKRHLWARHNSMVTDSWYRGQTPDGAWIYIETWAGRGRAVKKWIPAGDVKIYHPQPVVVLTYAGRSDDEQQHDLTA